MQRLREEKEMLYQQQLNRVRLQAELDEANAELSIHQSRANDGIGFNACIGTDTATVNAPNTNTSATTSEPTSTNSDIHTQTCPTNTELTLVSSDVNEPINAVHSVPTHNALLNAPQSPNARIAQNRDKSNTPINQNPYVGLNVQSDRPIDVAVSSNVCNSNRVFPDNRSVFPIENVHPNNNADSNNSPFLPFRAAVTNAANPQANARFRATSGAPVGNFSMGSNATTHVGQQLPSFVVKPPVFDGNSESYYNFTDAFDSLIDAKVQDPKLKMFYLLQHTEGIAHTLIQGCQYMPPESGYAAAKKLLRDHFGQKIQVATACINSVLYGPVLNKSHIGAILEFSAKLTACVYTLSGMNYLHKMDNVDIIRKLTKRFPPQWLASWEHTVDQILHVQKRKLALVM